MGDEGREGRGAIFFFPFFNHEVLNAENSVQRGRLAGVLLLVNTLGRGYRGITVLTTACQIDRHG